MKYETMIGLEIHAELLTETKCFCSCKASFGDVPNTHICPVCTGAPGSLPVLNRAAVEAGIKAGLALGCTINRRSAFDRKNYFYPDLPKAYQITQQRHPLCGKGEFRFRRDGVVHTLPIQRIHLEEDAAKLIHEETGTQIDYNRCGIPLAEIVTEPALTSGKEAAEAAEAIALALRYAGVCDARLEQGSLRVDVNVSLRDPLTGEPGQKVELKNLNSYRSIAKAVAEEERRQAQLLDNGQKVEQETRRYDENSGKTVSMRSKENAADYRYFPEPDLPDLILGEGIIEAARENLPELPLAREERYLSMGLGAETCLALVREPDAAVCFDTLVDMECDPKEASKLVAFEFLRMKKNGTPVAAISVESARRLLEWRREGKITALDLKALADHTVLMPAAFVEMAKSLGYLQEKTSMTPEEAVEIALAANPKVLAEYLEGKEKVFNFLFGQTMKTIGPGARPDAVRGALQAELERRKAQQG